MFLLHFTAFHPDFKMINKSPTSHSTLLRAKNIAGKIGIKYCYVGNVNDTKNQSTYCVSCGSLLIERNWHQTKIINLEIDKCKKCGNVLPGIYS